MIWVVKWINLLTKRNFDMSFTSETKAKLREALAEYEGYVKHLYLDTKGNVTVGVGHMLPDKNAMSGVIMYKVQNDKLTQPATLQEKMDEYGSIKKLPFSSITTARSFKQHTSLVMKDSDIDFLTNKHIDSFHGELKGSYTKAHSYQNNFDDFEPNLQLALFDMAFNLGTPTLKNNFPKFNTAIKSEDFSTAAKESHRKDIAEERNNFVKNLILSLVVEA